MSPELMDVDHRRITARVVLGIVVAVITTLILFSGGPKGPWVFAQTTSPTTGIEWVNPDDDTSTEISWKDDTSGGATGTTYHLVAWVRNAPDDATVNFSYRVGTGTPTNIGTATRVGATETYEFHWPASAAPADGTYNLVATLSSGGATPVASDSEEVVVNNTTETLPDPDALDPTSAQSETVEITAPANGGTLTFTEDPAADVNLKATVQVKHSADVTELTPYFTTSTPGAEPIWNPCDSGSETAAEAANGVDCELPPGTNGTSVTGIAVVASDDPTAPAPVPGPDAESGDAHRVTGTGASPGPSPSTSSPSPTASTTSPSPTPSTSSPSASPTPTQSSASPSPTTTTPPPPVVYPSTVTLKIKGAKFTGKVKSAHSRCRSGRNITLKKQTPGKDKTVGKDKTNGKGKYSIKERNAKGKYYAIAKSKGFTESSGRPVTCQRGKSPKRKA